MWGNWSNLLLAIASQGEGGIFITGLLNVISLGMGVVGVLMVFYAFYLFYLMATATDEGKRRAAKNRVFKVFSSMLIIVALVGILQIINVAIDDDISGKSSENGGKIENVLAGVSVSDLKYEINATAANENNASNFKNSFTKYNANDPNTYKLDKQYAGGELKINNNNIIAPTGTTVTAIDGFTVAEQCPVFNSNFWTVTTNADKTEITIKYQLYYSKDYKGKGIENPPKLSGKQNPVGTETYLQIQIAVHVTVQKGSSVQAAWVTGKMNIKTGSGVAKVYEGTAEGSNSSGDPYNEDPNFIVGP